MKKPSNSFSKFSTKRSNAAIKEQFKQEKRKIKKEREAFFEEKKRAARGPIDNTRVAGRGAKPGEVPDLGACCARAFRFVGAGRKKELVGWKLIRLRCAVEAWMTNISGCWMP